jgi:hypothetical protein
LPLNYVAITGTFDDGSGNPLSGSAVFTPSETVYASGVPVASAANPVSFPITGGILTGARLLATDNSPLSYEGLTGFFYWSVVVTLAGVSTASWSFFLPHTPSTVDLFSLANTAAAGGGFTSPMTTLGDIIVENATPAAARLAGNTTAAKQFLTQTGTGSISALPAWGPITPGDVPGVDGVTVTGTPSTGQVPTATGSSAATWQSPASVYQPYQFRPETYGAKGDGKIIVDATVAGGSLSTLTSASAGFVSGDTGKSILVANGITPFARTITFVNSTTVTLSSAAPGAVTSVGAIYGTDDTSAIQSAVNAAVTYAQGNASAYGEVVFSQTLYCVAGAAVVGGGTLGNSQITLPAISAASGHKVYLALKGLGQVAASPAHWLNPNVNPAGATLVCMRTDGTYDATFGPASVIGGPVSGYGGGGGTFSNMTLLVDGLTIMTPYYTSYGGLMLYGLAGMKIGAYAFMPLGVVVASTVWPQFLGGGLVTGGLQYTAGLIAPTTGNNDISEVDSYTCYGAFVGVVGADHLTIKALRTIFCGIGWLLNTGIPAGHTNHGASVLNWSCEATHSPIYAYNVAGWNGYSLSPGSAVVNVGMLSLESYTNPLVNADSAVQGSIYGLIYFEDLTPGGAYYGNENNCPGLKLVNLDGPYGPLVSPQAPPATGVAWLNAYYRDAWITLSSTASISALSIDSTAQNITAGAKQQFFLPSGHSYTPTYTGTLSHTVTAL